MQHNLQHNRQRFLLYWRKTDVMWSTERTPEQWEQEVGNDPDSQTYDAKEE